MAFGCPICSEKLDKLPAEAQSRAGPHGKELNISATPCGHIFHAYCIQKWLTGTIASNKQCPCCRKEVPKLRCLSLFPTSYDESILDDSISQLDGPAPVAPCNHGELITSLKNQVTRLQEDVKEKDLLCELLTSDVSSLTDKIRMEKMTSDTWMMKAKQYESYRDLANELEARAKKTESKLKDYQSLDIMMKGAETSVNEELQNFPPTEESIRSLLETRHVVTAELRSANKRYKDLNSRYEVIRQDKMKLKGLYDKKVRDYNELKNIHEIARVNGRVNSTSPMPCSSNALLDQSTTPKAFRSKRRLQEPLPSASTSSSSKLSSAKRLISPPGTDADVDVFQPSFKVKKAKSSQQGKKDGKTKFHCGLSPISKAEDKKTKSHNSTINLCSDQEDADAKPNVDSDDDDFEGNLRIRGNVPGAPLPIASKRMKNLQQKSEQPILGLTSKTKKFSFKKRLE